MSDGLVCRTHFQRFAQVLVLCLVAVLFGAGEARAELTLARLFSDHAVLQRDQVLPIWGWGDPGSTIEVELGEQQKQATADAQGRWQVQLEPLVMSVEPQVLVVRCGDQRLEVNDLLVGDVWLCSGQSNMEFPLGACDTPDEIAAADFPRIRQFGVEMKFAANVQPDVKGSWQLSSPSTAWGFSAVGYHFAKRVHQETGVPIGLVRSSVGGTNIELWMSQELLLQTKELEPYAVMMRQSLAEYHRDLATALPKIEAWTERCRLAQQQGLELPMPGDWPEFPFGERVARPRCVTLHNGMIAPLQPLAMTGVIWYQGENNAGSVFDGEQYVAKKRALIEDWRRAFRNPSLKFYYVQLAGWQKATTDPAGGDGWANFREAQRACLAIPGTGMASAVDVGDAEDIHPKNKRDVGERLARWALHDLYGQTIESSGPLFREAVIEGSAIRIEFDHVGNGLQINRTDRPKEDALMTLQHFAIAGEDRVWRWAEATIDGTTVVCHHPEIKNPVAVRYAFAMNPESANLYNDQNLPAAPFRTDDW